MSGKAFLEVWDELDARIAQLERELADEVTKSTGYYSMWESAASRADIAARDLAEAREKANEAEENARTEIERLKYERDVWRSKSNMHQKAAIGRAAVEAERDRLAAERDEARKDTQHWQSKYDDVLKVVARASLQPGEKGE
ncbi:hypothetical protein [Mesorhizobium sp. Pch-S]|uniref:hypothetical protein n=1 Tax=Mesorhizobium sp. Pch-S TaxID=2082387 RepID=UPI0010104E06|nr:hypothetical protein [Mesorhizobium sp. Pch-S]QAZ45903.1 hypothetical protein C1M53_26310 [Mesorhizobium sp. Pch-S]